MEMEPSSSEKQQDRSPEENLSEMISDRLLLLRQKAGLTPGKLAQKAGVSLLTVNLYENPYYEQYDLKTLKKLIEACGGSISLSIQVPL